MARSIAAIVIGFVFIAVLSFGADALLSRLAPGVFDLSGRIDNVPVLLFTQFYVAVFAIGGCYLAARIAGRQPMMHALVLGALGFAFTGINTIALWSQMPAWYHILALALVMPYAWIGGRLREAELRQTHAPVFVL